jgi:hypothetical protein
MIGTALAIGLAAASVGGSLASSAIASSGANKAASTQAQAATQAAEIQAKSAEQALEFEKLKWATDQANFSPWLKTGTTSLANLASLMGVLPPAAASTTQPGAGGAQPAPATSGDQPASATATEPTWQPGLPMNIEAGNAEDYTGRWVDPTTGETVAEPAAAASTTQPASGTADQTVDLASLVNPELGQEGELMRSFTLADFEKDPGYEFRLKEGQRLLQNTAAARGNLLTGDTAKALERYRQDYASGEFGAARGRYIEDQTNKFNRLSLLSGVGQTSAQQLSTNPSAAAIPGIITSSGAAQAQGINNAAAARASGYAAGGNIWGSTLGQMPSNLMNLYLLSKLGANQPTESTWV